MINVKSEIGNLKKVLLHKPGAETEMLTPNTFEELLFDDSYYLKVAQQEHDVFANTLRKNGVEVLYIEELAAKVLENPAVREKFIAQFIKEAGVRDENIVTATATFLESIVHKQDCNNAPAKEIQDTTDLVAKLMSGVRYSEIEAYRPKGIKTLTELAVDKVFVLDPLPNLVFTRDPFASIHNGVSLHKMASETRSRESIFSEYVIKHHPEFKGVEKFYDRTYETTLEGGDVMILNDEAIAVGLSVRTQPESIEVLAKNVFEKTDIKTVYAIDIPKGRSWMHLDTVFTQIDIDKFAVYTDYPFTVYKLVKGKKEIEKVTGTLEEIFGEIFGTNVEMILCGGGDPIHAAREQWNDGSNVLTIRPNEIITYSRNHVTNDILRAKGVIVHEIPSSELSRGRGGPRCMSMPLYREDVDWDLLRKAKAIKEELTREFEAKNLKAVAKKATKK